MLVIFSISSLFGQKDVDVFGGYNYSKLYFKNNPVDNSSNYNSYLFGFNYKIQKDRLLNWGISLNYINKTFRLEASSPLFPGSPGYEVIDDKFSLGIIAVDIYPEFSFGKKLRFFVNAGPSIGFIVHSKKEGIKYGSYFFTSYSNIESGSANGDFNPFDLGLRGAVGVSYPIIYKLSLYFETRYAIGLTTLPAIFYTSEAFANTKNVFVISGLKYRLD